MLSIWKTSQNLQAYNNVSGHYQNYRPTIRQPDGMKDLAMALLLTGNERMIIYIMIELKSLKNQYFFIFNNNQWYQCVL